MLHYRWHHIRRKVPMYRYYKNNIKGKPGKVKRQHSSNSCHDLIFSPRINENIQIYENNEKTFKEKKGAKGK